MEPPTFTGSSWGSMTTLTMILTTRDSMDARLDPNAMTGLEVGDAHIIRCVSSSLPTDSQRRLTSFVEQERRWTGGGCVEELDWVAGRFV